MKLLFHCEVIYKVSALLENLWILMITKLTNHLSGRPPFLYRNILNFAISVTLIKEQESWL